MTLVLFPAIPLQTLQEFVELIDLQIQFGQFRGQTGLVVQIVCLLERPPVDLDRFVRSERFRQRRTKCHDQVRLGRIDADGFAERIDSFF